MRELRETIFFLEPNNKWFVLKKKITWEAKQSQQSLSQKSVYADCSDR